MTSSDGNRGSSVPFLLGLAIGGLAVFVGLQFYKPNAKRIRELETRYKIAIQATEQAHREKETAAHQQTLASQTKDAAVTAQKSAIRDKEDATLESARLALALAEKEAEVQQRDATITERDETLRAKEQDHHRLVELRKDGEQRIRALEAQVEQHRIPADEQAFIEQTQRALREKDAAVEARQLMEAELARARDAETEVRSQAETLQRALAAAQEQVKEFNGASVDLEGLQEELRGTRKACGKLMGAYWVSLNIWIDFTPAEQNLLKEKAKAADFAWHRYPNGPQFASTEDATAGDAFDNAAKDILAKHGYDASWFTGIYERLITDERLKPSIDNMGSMLAAKLRDDLAYVFTQKVFHDKNK